MDTPFTLALLDPIHEATSVPFPLLQLRFPRDYFCEHASIFVNKRFLGRILKSRFSFVT